LNRLATPLVQTLHAPFSEDTHAFYARHGYRHVAHLPGFVQPGVAESLYVKKWPAPRHRK